MANSAKGYGIVSCNDTIDNICIPAEYTTAISMIAFDYVPGYDAIDCDKMISIDTPTLVAY